MSDPIHDRSGVSSHDAMASPPHDSLPETEDIATEPISNTVLQEISNNDNHCHENIENPVPVANTEIVKYAKRADGKDSKKVLFDEVYKALSENLECEPEEKEQLLFNLKVDIGKRIYKGKPPMPKDTWFGKKESGSEAIVWFIENFSDVLLFSEPKYKLVDFRDQNPKLSKALNDTFYSYHNKIEKVADEGLFKKIGIFNETPTSVKELFNWQNNQFSHVQSVEQSTSIATNTPK